MKTLEAEERDSATKRTDLQILAPVSKLIYPMLVVVYIRMLCTCCRLLTYVDPVVRS